MKKRLQNNEKLCTIKNISFKKRIIRGGSIMKKKKIFSLILLSTVFLTACTTGKTTDSGDTNAKEDTTVSADSEKSFNVAVTQEMPSADLSVATDIISFTALNNMYEGLYRVDEENKPQPAGANDFAEVSEDGLVYKLKLREDAKWSNGESVTAADYVYGWQRTVDPATGSQYAYLYEPVLNAKEIIEGDKKPDELGIKALGDYELEITLNTATPYLDYLFAFPSFFPQNEATVSEYGDQYAQTDVNAIYNGPFVLSNFEGPGTDTEWSYEKNLEYWDADQVKVDKINVSVVKESSTALNLFLDGQADDVTLTGELAQQNANDPQYTTVKQSRTTYVELNQNEEDSPFKNKDLRLALSYALDREALVNQVLGDGSTISESLIPREMSFDPDNDKDFVDESTADLSFDEAKAKDYWEKAKKELDIDSLSFELLSDDTDSVKKVAEYIQGAWTSALDGLEVSVTNVPFSVRLDRTTNRDFEVVVGGWGADYADPSSFTDLFITDNTYNRGGWSNAEYDQLTTDAATTYATDPSARFKALIEAEGIIMEDMGVIPVYQKAEGHLISEKVKGIVSHGAGAPYDYKWTFIE